MWLIYSTSTIIIIIIIIITITQAPARHGIPYHPPSLQRVLFCKASTRAA